MVADDAGGEDHGRWLFLEITAAEAGSTNEDDASISQMATEGGILSVDSRSTSYAVS